MVAFEELQMKGGTAAATWIQEREKGQTEFSRKRLMQHINIQTQLKQLFLVQSTALKHPLNILSSMLML